MLAPSASQRSLGALARQDAVVITTLRQTGPLGGLPLGFLLILAGTVPLPLRANQESLSWQDRGLVSSSALSLTGPGRPVH